jgi:hypothetical protein
MDILRQSAKIADDVIDFVDSALKRFDTPHGVHSRKEALGAIGEVSVGISNGGTGEIVAVVGHSLQHYCAKSARAEDQIGRGTKIRIVDVGPNVMFVEAYKDSELFPTPVEQTLRQADDWSQS